MNLRPLEQWYCDVCGEIIEKPEDGYVVWGRSKDDSSKKTDFRIIHQSRCDDNKLPSSAALSDFLGQKGLNYLLYFLSVGPIMKNVHKQAEFSAGIKDLDEYVDFFRRVQVPYYEEARQKFTNPDLLDDFCDANEMFPYQVKILERIAAGYE